VHDDGPLAARVVAIARSQLGVSEAGDEPNDGEPSRRYMGGRREPWCAWFVAWCFREAGRALPEDIVPDGRASPLAGVAYMERVFEREGWLVRAPMPGDVVFFGRRMQSDPGRGRHVGIVDETFIHMIRCVEGNVGNRVAAVPYRRTTLERVVTSYGRVPERI
jgi:cell wall-associated NlpC family hydrolase